MKIILSRKGFDSSVGGVPSPIFPDGSLLSLPIPDKTAKLAYEDIGGNQWARVGELVQQLAGMPPTDRAHLDPDLRSSSILRAKGWRPIFGQAGSAESHLRNQKIETGDMFLYFGLFRHVERINSEWRYIRGSKPMHVLFGWLKIASRVVVSAWPPSQEWAHYHPHFGREDNPRNVLYVSADHLSVPGFELNGIPGADTFETIYPQQILTASDSTRPGRWSLPKWFHPSLRASVLSYHAAESRWQRDAERTILSSASRGQEFVLDCDDYPEAFGWLQSLFAHKLE